MKTVVRVTLLAIVFVAAWGPGLFAAASKQDSPEGPLSDKLRFSLGVFLVDFDTDASVGTGTAIGTSFNAENLLNLENDQSVFRIDGQYRFNSRHALGFGYYNLNRTGSAVLDQPFNFNGVDFTLGGSLESDFGQSWARTEYRYSALRSSKGEAGFTAGLSVYDFSFMVKGQADITDPNGMVIGTSGVLTRDDLVAPVPTLGLFVSFAPIPRLLIHLKADFLKLSVNDVEGNVKDTSVVIEWLFSRHVGVAIGTANTRIDITDNGDDAFAIDWDQSSLLGYLTFSFFEPSPG